MQSKMRQSSLVMNVMMLAVMILTPKVSLSLPPNCTVASSFSTTLTSNNEISNTFWGFIKNDTSSTLLKVYLYEYDIIPYKSITCNHTHVTTVVNNWKDNEESSTAVSWPVCSAWRQFQLEVHHETLTITDDRNNIWINTTVKSSSTELVVVMDYFNSSCITLTPVREMKGGVPLHFATPHGSDALHFILEAKDYTQLQVTVGNVSLPLGQLSPSQPHLRLTVKSIPGASPVVVDPGVLVTVVSVGCGLSTFSLLSVNNTLTIMQHLLIDLQTRCDNTLRCELPSSGGPWCRSTFFISGFLSAVVGFLVFVVTSCFCHFKMKRSSLLWNQQQTRPDINKVTNRAEVESALYLEPRPPPSLAKANVIPTKPCFSSATPIYENVEKVDDALDGIYDVIE